jgi:hypothetical protein
VVAVYSSQFGPRDFLALIRYYLVGIEIVALIGIAQHFKFIDLPGDQGMSSTLGNSDFYSALLGTTFPLLLILALNQNRKSKVLLGAIAMLNVYSIYLAGPLQGYVDIALFLIALSPLAVSKFIPRRDFSLNARTYVLTFGAIIWAEIIFLMPFLGKMIPILGNDIQVKIRANFWMAGVRQFLSHPLLGVGPDQYGNYYEQFRTLSDVKNFPQILSNDAHSASVQTLATTGLLGTLFFIGLLGLVFRSLVIIWDNKMLDRKIAYLFGVYIFVYLSNSFVSPITLSHKVVFWTICGFLVGVAYRSDNPTSRKMILNLKKIVGLGVAILAIAAAAALAHAHLNYAIHIEKYAEDNQKPVLYNHSPVIPCFAYFNAEMLMTERRGEVASIGLAQKVLQTNPRCVDALIYLGKNAVNRGDTEDLGKIVSRLIAIAPSRSDTIALGMFYANATGNEGVKLLLEREMKTLGLVYIPGKLG